MTKCRNIALLFFSRTAKAEAKNKKWCNHQEEVNYKIASTLIYQSRNALKQSGLPIFHFDEGNQTGETFGQRLSNAYQQLFDKGYDAVIAVGNDNAEIGTVNWDQICAELRNNKWVLGPDLRGGAYLIGITREAFDSKTFERLPWQTAHLFQALRSLSAAESTFILPRQRDINSLSDLRLAISENDQAILKILEVLFIGSYITSLYNSNLQVGHYLTHRLRGPPLL